MIRRQTFFIMTSKVPIWFESIVKFTLALVKFVVNIWLILIKI